jgi:hypothetical protein
MAGQDDPFLGVKKLQDGDAQKGSKRGAKMRPSKLTQEIIGDVEDLLPCCLHLSTIADFIGVHKSNVGRWMKRGEQEWEQGQSSLHALFYRVAKRAQAAAEMYLVSCIVRAAQGAPPVTTTSTHTDREGNTISIETTTYSRGEWTAGAWILERRFPEKWSKDRRAIRGLVKAVRELQERVDAVG